MMYNKYFLIVFKDRKVKASSDCGASSQNAQSGSYNRDILNQEEIIENAIPTDLLATSAAS